MCHSFRRLKIRRARENRQTTAPPMTKPRPPETIASVGPCSPNLVHCGTTWPRRVERLAALAAHDRDAGGQQLVVDSLPWIQAALPEAMDAVRALGFCIGPHTSGAVPERLAALLPLVDWVGFNVKAPFADYARITGVAGSGESARLSLSQLIASGVACDLRTTVHPAPLDDAALARLADDLAALGVTTHLQPFRASGCIDAELIGSSKTDIAHEVYGAAAGGGVR